MLTVLIILACIALAPAAISLTLFTLVALLTAGYSLLDWLKRLVSK